MSVRWHLSIWLGASSSPSSAVQSGAKSAWESTNKYFQSIINRGTHGFEASKSNSGPSFEPHITLYSFEPKGDLETLDLEKVFDKVKELSLKLKTSHGDSSNSVPLEPFPVKFSALRKGSRYFQSVLLEIDSDANEKVFAMRKAAEEAFAPFSDGTLPPKYYPHLSLHYGDEEPLRESIFKLLSPELSAEKLAALDPYVVNQVSIVATRGNVSEWIPLGLSPFGGIRGNPAFYRQSMFVANNWVPAKRCGRIPIINPATREEICTVPAATKEDVDEAVKSAHQAFKTWSQTTGAERAKYLRAIAQRIRERRDELARLETVDNGKPLKESVEDINDSASCFEYYATLAEELDQRREKSVTIENEAFSTKTRLEPIGVCGLIIPWNYPLLMNAWKIAPSLAAGCTLVLKTSELTPLTSLELAAICKQVLLPSGVVNIITGYGPDAGGPLSSHPLVSKVAFTGSVPTGRKVYQSATADIKRVTLELGGKSPIIVFDDVEIDKAVEWIMVGIFFNQGQVCSATSRLIVHKNISDKLLARLVEETRKLKIGDGLDDVDMGPVVSEGQYKKVLDYIAKGKSENATVLLGDLINKDTLKGYFVSPTIFTNVEENMTIWKEEIFGPVLSVKTFTDEDEAIAIANNSNYGLGAAVLSRDKARCQRVAEHLDSGIVWVNCSQPTFIQAPWGGVKQSGIGRELGPWGLENYLQVKQITTYESDDAYGWYIKS